MTLGKTRSFNFYLITKVFNDVIFFYSEIDALKHRRPMRNSNTQQLSYLSYRMFAAVYTSQALALYQPEARADRLCDLATLSQQF